MGGRCVGGRGAADNRKRWAGRVKWRVAATADARGCCAVDGVGGVLEAGRVEALSRKRLGMGGLLR